MSEPLLAIDLLDRPAELPEGRIYVLAGDDPFLKSQALSVIKIQITGGDEGEFAFHRWDGSEATPRDVFDELNTVGLFGSGSRLVMVTDADSFVTKYRSELESMIPQVRSGSALVLDVNAWPSNTRLYKLSLASGAIVKCTAPPEARLAGWVSKWGRARHGIVVDRQAADALVEIVGPNAGLLDQELSKLALVTPPESPVRESDVRDIVGGWRAKTAWSMLDAALDGQAAESLEQLDRLLMSGEHPVGILAQISSTLRRFSQAALQIEHAELVGERIQLRTALERAGVKPFVMARAEAQLRRLGRARALRLPQLLLDADLALKGTSSAPARARLTIEQLLVGLAQSAPLRAGKSGPHAAPQAPGRRP
jgi:DNA polymerase-3 subunit delta